MNIKTLLKVPVYCAISSMVSFYILIYFLVRFTIVNLPDGTISVDRTKTLIVYGTIFAVVVFVGKIFFRGMTKREIFISATVIVVFQMAVTLVSYFIGAVSGPMAILLLYLSEVGEWSQFVFQFLYRFTDNGWICNFAQNFAPYIFVLFGIRDRHSSNHEQV